MIEINTGNTKYKNISQDTIRNTIKTFQLKRRKLGFIDIDQNIDTRAIKKYTKSVDADFENVVVLGIGGSALGTKALLESLYGKYYNEIPEKKGKNIYVLDNIDTHSIDDLQQVIDIPKTLFIFISKSGTTIETLSEYLYFREICKQQNDNWKNQFCFIIGENCKMREKIEPDFQCFYIPENIGGRFSVFTPVGLLPLALAGVDITLFTLAFSEHKERFLSENIQENTALHLALLQYHYYKNEQKNITVFFPYSSRMFQVGEWYKQLMGESIGKDGKGITLTSSLGVTDQHSQLQLFQDGPQDKFFLTLDIKNPGKDFQIYNTLSFKKLLDIEQYGTETSLKHEGHPLCNISLSKLDAPHIAGLLYMLMFQVAYLGELFVINAFDQPGVEKSKIITKEKLTDEFGDIDLFKEAFYE